MSRALELAREAERHGEVPVGALLVSPEGECLAAAWNRPIGLNDPTAHAEMLVLREAGLRLGNYRLTGTTFYVTLEPCPMCAMAMVHARVSRVVFAAPDPRTGACGSLMNLVQHPTLNHRLEVTGGVLAEESAQLLRGFFQGRR
ncbi:MAG: tRNA adenosine(34) deaminase TadA [Gammaproteobacteria bacterium]|nr:tRNA adenosine(34) deaminase TadA [Gammaproteobacteria bacterium]TVQ47408.1 MAG: tRNA adenosine(34) deaminase TadA [Gammaproteobacteria bacterium]